MAKAWSYFMPAAAKPRAESLKIRSASSNCVSRFFGSAFEDVLQLNEQHRAAGLGKGLATGMADIAAFCERMDANASACATRGAGAYYQLRTHRWKGGIEHASNLLMRSVLSNRPHDALQRYPKSLIRSKIITPK